MNPIALIVLLGAGIIAIKTMTENYTGDNLSVKIVSVDSVKISLTGLQFNCSVMITSPHKRTLTYDKAIINTTINNEKFSQTQTPGIEIKKGMNMQALETVIPYDKIIPIIKALTLNKISNANVIMSLDVKAGGYTGSAIKTFKLDNITKIKI